MNTNQQAATSVASARKIAMVAGVLYLLTFVSIPTLALYGEVKEANYVIGAGRTLPPLLAVSWRSSWPSPHRHRRRSIFGAQEAERRVRVGPHRLPNSGSQHHIRRRGVSSDNRDLAAGRSWSRGVGHQPCTCLPL